MKKLEVDVSTNEIVEVDLTQEEIDTQEADRLAWEAEQAKPKSPTAEERLASIEDLLITLI